MTHTYTHTETTHMYTQNSTLDRDRDDYVVDDVDVLLPDFRSNRGGVDSFELYVVHVDTKICGVRRCAD